MNTNRPYNMMNILWLSCSSLTLLIIFCVPNCAAIDRRTIFNDLAGSCDPQVKTALAKCIEDAQYEWDVLDTDMNTYTRKFCCYEWDILNCQVAATQNCDPRWASDLTYRMEQSYGAICEYHYRNSASCLLRWWSISLIVIGGLFIIALIVFVIYRRKQTKFSREYKTGSQSYLDA